MSRQLIDELIDDPFARHNASAAAELTFILVALVGFEFKKRFPDLVEFYGGGNAAVIAASNVHAAMLNAAATLLARKMAKDAS